MLAPSLLRTSVAGSDWVLPKHRLISQDIATIFSPKFPSPKNIVSEPTCKSIIHNLLYTSVRLISRWYTTTRCRNNNCGWTIIWKFEHKLTTRQLRCKLLVARLLYYSLRHLARHCSRVSKLFPFPSQPPYMNCSHAAV